MAGEEHIVVGLSGGVDSAVAAMLLKEAGHELTAVFMKNWEEDDTAGECSAEEDLAAARAVCAHLDIPLRTVNFATEYWDRVFQYFLAEYRANRTPNPDVLCNREIKFRAFLDYALSLGARRIATGHYAGIRQQNGRYQLLKSADADKDQTYFLHLLDQHQLARTLFPLGDLTKQQVRERAQAAGLPNYARKDSTGICFIGERDFRAFLARYLPAQPGEMRTLDGEHKGQHGGLMYYTIGQRQGLGIGGPGGPWFVVDKDVRDNTLYVGTADEPALHASGLEAEQTHWIAGEPPGLPLRCTARIRHRQAVQTCCIQTGEDGTIEAWFDEPQRAVTPGQSVVLYRDEVCLGGGIIRRALKPGRPLPSQGPLQQAATAPSKQAAAGEH